MKTDNNSEAKPIGADFLDSVPCVTCGQPDCDHYVNLSGRCHPGAPAIAGYTRGSGFLELRCSVCNHLLAQVAIMPGNSMPMLPLGKIEEIEVTESKLRWIFTEIAGGAGEHGDFLKTFALAFSRADRENFLALLPAAATLIVKYDLMKLLPGEERAMSA